MAVLIPPIRTDFLEKDSQGKLTGKVSWHWIKYLMELQGLTPFDVDSLIALTIEETQPVDAAEQAAQEAIIASQPDPTPFNETRAEEIATGVALMLSDPAAAAALTPVQVIGCTIDGGGAVPATGFKSMLVVPYNCFITGWTLVADQAGDCQITISAGTYAAFPVVSSIVAAAPPAMTGMQKNTSTTLTGWTTTIEANTVLSFNLDSVATVTWILLMLQIVRIP